MHGTVRKLVRKLSDPDTLEAFERRVAEVDRLWARLNEEDDPARAQFLATDWGVAIRQLARMEATILLRADVRRSRGFEMALNLLRNFLGNQFPQANGTEPDPRAARDFAIEWVRRMKSGERTLD